MRLRHVAVATTLVLVGTTFAASPASARVPDGGAAPRPVVTMVRGGDHFPSSITTTVPPGGTSLVTTPALDKNIKKLKVEIEPEDHSADDEAAFEQFNTSLGTLSKGKRLLVCTMMYLKVIEAYSPYGNEERVDGYHLTYAGAIMLACLHLAGLLEGDPPTSVRSAAAPRKCAQFLPSLPATVSKGGGGYSVAAEGTTAKAKKPDLKVKCRVIGSKVSYTVRPRKKGKTLRQVVGKNLMIGIKSPADASMSLPVKVTFSRP
jgi:hypothetical protein